MLDKCENIVEKVKGAKVTKSSLELSFDPGICIKCSCSIKETEGKEVLKGTFIPYNKAFCHPLFIPKYDELEDIFTVNGMRNLVLNKTHGRGHDPSDEVCHKCRKSPGEEGCLLVGTKYEITIQGKQVGILVDHTNMVEKHRMLSRKGSDND